MLRAFHAALRNSPVNTKNQAVKVKGVMLQLCWVVLGPGLWLSMSSAKRELPGSGQCLFDLNISVYQGRELALGSASTEFLALLTTNLSVFIVKVPQRNDHPSLLTHQGLMRSQPSPCRLAKLYISLVMLL